MRSAAGFTIVEMVIATALTLLLTAALFGLVDPARGGFQAQPEAADMHQRLRVAVDALTRDLLMAGAGIAPGAAPAVVPYRVGRLASDVDTAVLYRPGVITVTYIRSSESGPTSRTYYLRDDPATDAPQLMRYDGIETDLPVVDHVVGLDFAYFDEGQTRLDPAVLQDGPWAPSDPDVGMFDADLLRIRRVRVVLRVEAALAAMRGAGTFFTRGGTSTSAGRYAPDHELQFDIALRNADR
jgi:hypothetical protein